MILGPIFKYRGVLRKGLLEHSTLDIRRSVKASPLESVYPLEGIRRSGGSTQGWVSTDLRIALGIPAGRRDINIVACGPLRKRLALVADVKDISLAQLPLNAEGVVPGFTESQVGIIETNNVA